MKKIIIVILVVVALVFCNGCYYILKGQHKAAEKICQGNELSVYEKCSAYSANIAIWCFGWVLSPEAAEQAFLAQFVRRCSEVYRSNAFFLKSNRFQEQTADRFGKSEYSKVLHYEARDFVPGNGELRYALAIDGALYSLGWSDNVPIEQCSVEASYKDYIGKFSFLGLTVSIDYSVLRYLQQIGWLRTYTITYLS